MPATVDSSRTLINDLLADPEAFFNEGRSYDLLQEYFKSGSVKSLGPLLGHENLFVRKTAVWIGSELAERMAIHKERIVWLLRDSDRYVCYYALECLAIISSSGVCDLFYYIVKAISNSDDVLIKLSMNLISNASDRQLKEGLLYFSSNSPDSEHVDGLSLLLDKSVASAQDLNNALKNKSSVFIRYSAIYYKRKMKDIGVSEIPSLHNCTDLPVRKFLNL